MSALLHLISLQSIMLWIINFYRGITPDQWARTLEFVTSASSAFKESADKKKWVEAEMQLLWKDMKPGAIEMLRVLVVAYAQKKGLAI